MSSAKKFAAGLMIALSLTLAGPALAAPPSLFAQAEANLAKGAHYYAEMVSGWFEELTSFFQHLLPVAASVKGAGAACETQDQCQSGLACLNACPTGGTDCEIASKRCAPRPKELRAIGQNGNCTFSDVCADSTACTRVCPSGLKCAADRLCLPLTSPAGSCAQDADCRATCADRPLPSVSNAAFAPACENHVCLCHVALIDPSLPRVACPSEIAAQPLICPNGTAPGCTQEGCTSGTCPAPRLTCLLAPEFGGKCFDSNECSKTACPTGTSSFCSEGACKCQSSKIETIECLSDTDCAGITCEPGQVKACVNGACACGIKTTTETGQCQTAADCPANAHSCVDVQTAADCQGDCPANYNLACVDSRCACQRTTEAAPVPCADVDECGAISCPQGFDKVCLNAVCSCTRTTIQ